MIFTADDEDILKLCRVDSRVDFVKADIVIWIGSIPIKSTRDRSAWNTCTDDVGSISCLFRVQDDPVVDWTVSRNDDVIGRYDTTVTCGYLARLTVDDLISVCVREDLSAIANDCTSETVQILERMELSLSGETKCRASVPELRRCSVNQLDFVKTSAMRSIELALKLVRLAVAAVE